MRRLTILVALCCCLSACGERQETIPGESAPAATVALDFVPNAVHAGIFEARRGGAPLEVRSPAGSTDSLKLLLAGRADVAVMDIHDLGLALQRGQDVVGVGALVQKPLAAVIARSKVERPRDLEGRRVGVTGLPSDDAVLRAVVESDGGDFAKVRRVTIGFSAVPTLAAGKVDAATAFWNAEGVALKQKGVETNEFRVSDHGAPPYPELVLVTKRATLEKRRDLVKGVVDEIREGTRRALAEPAPALRAVAKASGTKAGDVQAQFDAVKPALSPPLDLNRDALERWAAFDARFGILERAPDVSRAFAFGL
jgi:NitT/TauT family transport system substrate-binding protein/putative hydroxymethylpyrimidine transport system substrate-binding protein